MRRNPNREKVQQEIERRYGYFRGEHPDRARTREILETEPMARWLAINEIASALAATPEGTVRP